MARPGAKYTLSHENGNFVHQTQGQKEREALYVLHKTCTDNRLQGCWHAQGIPGHARQHQASAQDIPVSETPENANHSHQARPLHRTASKRMRTRYRIRNRKTALELALFAKGLTPKRRKVLTRELKQERSERDSAQDYRRRQYRYGRRKGMREFMNSLTEKRKKPTGRYKRWLARRKTKLQNKALRDLERMFPATMGIVSVGEFVDGIPYET